MQDLGDYVLETQKRQTQVRIWFDQSVVVCHFQISNAIIACRKYSLQSRNNEAARTMSKKYVHRIKTIPPPALRRVIAPRRIVGDDVANRLRSSSPGYVDENELGLEFGDDTTHRRHRREYDNANEDSVSVLEEALLGEGYAHHFGKKRSGHAAHSDASSDVEVLSVSRGISGHVSKRRRLEAGYDGKDDFDQSVIDDDGSQSISTLIARKSSAGRGKGKGRGTPPVGSLSAAPQGTRSRLPKGSRKKGDLLSLRGQEFGPPSVAGSIAGDLTPAGSVPPSPALSASVIFEIGDVAPPLKRAKKIDDTAMQKRLSALEETQRKVWTNIARRDVAKVFLSLLKLQ